MSNTFDTNRGLIWKEVRQLFPFVRMLFALGAGLILFWQMLPSQTGELAEFGRYIPLALPALFAVGAAAISISQEREQNTLWWLMSMPIAPPRLIRIKFLVCLSALGVMWIGCWTLIKIELLAGLFPGGFRFPFLPNLNESSFTTYVNAVLFWHLHSLYVLVCGFYASWRIKNSFASLIAIVPLAFAPFALVQFGYYMRWLLSGSHYIDSTVSDSVTLAVTLLAILLVGLLARRAAFRVLSPAKSATPKQLLGSGRFSPYALVFSSADATRPVPDKPFRLSVIALFWQSLNHNRLALAGIIVMLLAGLIGSGLPYGWYLRGYSEVFMWVGCFGSCCLGVFAFAGDGNARNLRFFADRGVSPFKLWLGRHLLAVAVFSIGSLIYICVGIFVQSVPSERGYIQVLPLVVVLVSATYCYLISQWVGQVIQMLPASIILAPIATAVSLSVGGLAVSSLRVNSATDATTVIALACTWFLLPLLATLLTMRKFADGERGRRFYARCAPAFILLVAIPFVPMMVEYFRFAKITGQHKSTLVDQATKAYANRGLPVKSIVFNSPDPEAVRTQDEREISAAQLVRFPDDPLQNRGASVAPQTFDQIDSLASFAQIRFDQSPDNAAWSAELIGWVDTMTRMSKRLRHSWRLIDQDQADAAENWIAVTLSLSSYQPHLESSVSQAAIQQIGDKRGRFDGRRRAVLISWSAWNQKRQSGSPVYEFGGYSISSWPGFRDSAFDQWLFHDHSIDAIAFNLLSLLDAEENGQTSLQQRRSLWRLITGSDANFEKGAYSDRARRSEASQAVVMEPELLSRYPGSQWYASWETDTASNE